MNSCGSEYVENPEISEISLFIISDPDPSPAEKGDSIDDPCGKGGVQCVASWSSCAVLKEAVLEAVAELTVLERLL